MRKILTPLIAITVLLLALLLAGAGVARMAPAAATATGTATTTPAAMATRLPTALPTVTRTPPPPGTQLPRAPAYWLALTPTPLPFDMPLYPPNEMGDVLVLAYHRIDRPADRWTRTPEDFRLDLEYLLTHGYYPVNVTDLARGDLGHVPAGRRPVALTFDDSTRGHYRILPDGSLDPDCAVAMLRDFSHAYGEHWPLRATFFVLLDDADEPGGPLFRQPGRGEEKLRTLVEWGMEVGSHTIGHTSLADLSPEEVAWELAVSRSRIEALLPGYRVRSLALPFGVYPWDVALAQSGYSETAGLRYTYEAVLQLGAKPCPSPHSDGFDPLFIPRVQATEDQLRLWLGYFEQHPERYYASGGEEEE